MLIFFSSF